ncbi:SDR family oxidoreductase [Actinocrispum sp. NPDC049592]|uniref:SDR family oxidoreductase n=1 Tax=Actinocrispum sp. NPDC049592 TaxID=3154835 RepID=UPI0034357C42
MRVFVTGATGFIGSAVVRELLGAGHQVLGLARSDQGEASLRAAGADVLRGGLAELDVLREGAKDTDGVIHTAFIHDFTDYLAAARTDRLAIEAMGDVLAGSDRPFVVSAALGLADVATEEDAIVPGAAARVSEEVALGFADRGVRVSVMRLPASVHGEGDHGFVPRLIEIAREKGVSAYPGDGSNHWPAVHRFDAARLFRLALERAPAGTRLHPLGDKGIPLREIAGVIGRHLGLPVVSAEPEHFGWLGRFVALDVRATSAITEKLMDWRPEQPGLIEDLEAGHYFTS